MNRLLIISLTFFEIINAMTTVKADTEFYGRADAANKNSSITAIYRRSNGQAWLVLRKDNVDLLKMPAVAYQVFLEDAWLQDGRLAVVLDYDFSLAYQLYSLEGGNWKLQRQTAFYPLDLGTRASLLLVQTQDLTHVLLTCAKEGDVARVSGVVEPDDRKFVFEFSNDGTVLKNGHPYRLK